MNNTQYQPPGHPDNPFLSGPRYEWWCAKCKEKGMPWTHVTYEETHEGCGGTCVSVPIEPAPTHGSAVDQQGRVEMQEVRAQLAAAQSEAAALRVSWQNAEERATDYRDALEWYADRTRFYNAIGREGDAARNSLAQDAGKRAQATLDKHNPQQP